MGRFSFDDSMQEKDKDKEATLSLSALHRSIGILFGLQCHAIFGWLLRIFQYRTFSRFAFFFCEFLKFGGYLEQEVDFSYEAKPRLNYKCIYNEKIIIADYWVEYQNHD